jgi:hypothetical protein
MGEGAGQAAAERGRILAMSAPRPHPHFNDKGTLDWHTSWKEALGSAKAQGKLIFIEFGREA